MRLFVGTKLKFLHGRKLIYRTLCSGVRSEFLIIAMATWMI